MRGIPWVWGLGLTLLLPSASPAQARPIRAPTLAEDLQLFSQIFHQVRLNHFDSVSAHALVMAAIEGMLREADPHSYMLPATRLAPETVEALRRGDLVPIPITFQYLDGAPFVLAITPGSKASVLDIRRGDELVAVDGTPILAESPEELAFVLAGRKGTKASLRFRRSRSDGTESTVEREVQRETSDEAPAVTVAEMVTPRTGYLRVTSFLTSGVGKEVDRALKDLLSRGMEFLILDLRDNGGGSVAEAVEMAHRFLPPGATVTISELRGAPPDTFRVPKRGNPLSQSIPMAVLVNRGTASAAELLVGALQDNDRAMVVGQRTFGKSLLMSPLPLVDGSLVMLVTGRLRTPCGRLIQREYRTLTRREYFRRAGSTEDTTAAPQCVTGSGRALYGGGGIRPDSIFPPSEGIPQWLGSILESHLLDPWASGFGGSLPSIDSLVGVPSPPAGAVEDAIRFLGSRGAEVPDGTGNLLVPYLLRQLVVAQYGVAAWYRLFSRLDPEVRRAVNALEGR